MFHIPRRYRLLGLKEYEDDAVVYRCNDTGWNPKFDKLVFEVKRKQGAGSP